MRLFIDSTSKIAQFYNISGYTISFFLVAVATSLPEMMVSVTSALEKNPILAYGNVLGSNVALLTLVVAIPGLIGKGISTRKIFRSKDIYFTILFSVLAIALGWDKVFGKLDGFILLAAYVIYIFAILKERTPLERLFAKFSKVNIWKQSIVFLFSLTLLLISSQGIVRGALYISESLKLNLVFIGLTITAIGTSLPEIAFVISESKNGSQEEIMGDVVGSVVANTSLVLGLAAIIHPIKLYNGNVGFTSLGFLIVSLILFFVFSKTKKRLDKKESFVLFLLYIVFLIVEFSFRAA